MVMFILISHIVLAVLSLVYAGGVISDSRKRQLERALTRTKTMWYGTLSTVATGILLTIITGSSIGRLCGSLFTFLLVVGVAHVYQRNVRHRLIS